MESCRVYRLTAFASPLSEAQLPIPQPKGAEVLLRVTACGVCHTDLHVRDGGFDLGQDRRLDYRTAIGLPRILGHEIAGEILARGPEAETALPVGTRVVVYPWIGCGSCPRCKVGNDNLCMSGRSLGIRADGGYATHVLVPHPRYLIETGSLDPSFACTLACSGLTAWGALRKVPPGAERLLVIGAGGVGLSAIRFAATLLGLAPAVAEADKAKWAAARAAGAVEIFDATEAAADATFDAVIDFVGVEATATLALGALAKGGSYICVGLFGGAMTVPLPLLALRAHTLRGSYVGTLAEMRELVSLAREGRLAPIPLDIRPLEAANAAHEDLQAGRVVGRIVLTP